MGNEAQDLTIKLNTVGEPAGANAVATAVEKTNAAVKSGNAIAKDTVAANRKTADSSRDAAKGLIDQGEAAEQAAGGARVLTEVANGNVAAISKIGPVLKALKATLSTTLGAFSILLTVAVAIIGKIQEKMAEKKENQLKLEADRAKVAFDAAADAAQELNRQKTEALQAQLQAIDDTAKSAVDRVQRLVDIAGKLDDVHKATELAEIESNSSLTAEEKLNAKTDVNQRYAAKKEAGVKQIEDAQLNAVGTKIGGIDAEKSAATTARDDARKRADLASGKTFLEMMKPLEEQLRKAQEENPGTKVEIPMLTQLQKAFANTQTPDGEKYAQTTKTQLDAAEAAYKATQERLKAALKERDELEQRIADERAGRGQLAEAVGKQDKRQYNLDLLEARKTDEAAPRRAAPKPDEEKKVYTIGSRDGAVSSQLSDAERERARAGAVANVAGAQASQIANDTTASDGVRKLATNAAAAAKALEGDQSAAAFDKVVTLMEDLATLIATSKAERAKDMADTATRLRAIEARIAAAGRS